MSETIHLADEEIANFDKNLPITKENNPQNEFSKSSAGYYRCKKRDSALYLLLKKEYSRYVSDDKLKECCHEYDTNINESLNNIRNCLKNYASKEKAHICINCGFKSVKHFWQCPSCQRWSSIKKSTFDKSKVDHYVV